MTVYFIKRTADDSGLIKIGYTDNLKIRLSQFKVAAPEGVEVICTVPGGRELEEYIHSAFEQNRFDGEWFYPAKDLLTFIDIMKRQGLSALPAGVVPLRRVVNPHDYNQADIILASRLLKKLAPVGLCQTVGERIRHASSRLNWSYSRVKEIWYQNARMISSWEMRSVFAASNEEWINSAEQQEIQDLRARLERLESKVASA